MSTATPEAVNGDAPPISDPTDPEAAPERPPEPPQPDEQPMPDQDLPPDGDQPADTPPNEAEADLPDGDDHGEEAVSELLIEGNKQLSLNVGGAKPTESVFKIQGGKLSVEGQFSKGDIVQLAVTVRIGAVTVADKINSEHGNVESTTRAHIGRIEAARRVY
jgi:hypothetical protein